MVRNMRIFPFEAGGTFDSSGSSVSNSAPPLDSSRAYVRGVVVGTAVLSEGLQTQGLPFKAGNNVKLSAHRSANCLFGDVQTILLFGPSLIHKSPFQILTHGFPRHLQCHIKIWNGWNGLKRLWTNSQHLTIIFPVCFLRLC